MARPKAKELTERELEIMHVFWQDGRITANQVRDAMAKNGRELAYTTVATLIKILTEKGFIRQTNDDRPFEYEPIRSFDEVSGSLLSDVVHKVFQGSRTQLLMRLMDQERLSESEVGMLQKLLQQQDHSSKRKRTDAEEQKDA